MSKVLSSTILRVTSVRKIPNNPLHELILIGGEKHIVPSGFVKHNRKCLLIKRDDGSCQVKLYVPTFTRFADSNKACKRILWYIKNDIPVPSELKQQVKTR